MPGRRLPHETARSTTIPTVLAAGGPASACLSRPVPLPACLFRPHSACRLLPQATGGSDRRRCDSCPDARKRDFREEMTAVSARPPSGESPELLLVYKPDGRTFRERFRIEGGGSCSESGVGVIRTSWPHPRSFLQIGGRCLATNAVFAAGGVLLPVASAESSDG